MLYEYTKTQLPHLQYIHDEVAASEMTDKSIEWCNWEEDEQKLKVNFTNTLSAPDKTILDGIVAACPNEANDVPGELSIKNGDKYIGFKSPAVLTEDTLYVLPEDGATGQAMVTDGEKNLSFQTIPIHLVEDTTPQLGGELDAQNHSIGFTEQVLVVTAQACAINWKNGNKAKLTVDDDVTITFGTAPSNPCSLMLVIVQDGTGSHTVTLPAAIKWAGGTAPTLSTAANSIDIISLYFDGSVYYGLGNADFKTA